MKDLFWNVFHSHELEITKGKEKYYGCLCWSNDFFIKLDKEDFKIAKYAQILKVLLL